MYKFDFFFEMLKCYRLLLIRKKSINYFGDMLSYTQQFKHNNYQNASFDCAERCWMLYVPM